jgi:putative membrane protein
MTTKTITQRKSLQTEKFNRKDVGIFIIALSHLVLLFGLLSPSLTPLFLRFIPLYLLMMLSLLIYTHRDKNKDFKLCLLVTFLAGFLIEVIGVNTGYIFGSFQFGDTLGFQLAGVPVMSGVLWVILIYSVGITIAYLKIQNHAIRSLIGAFVLVLMDILIEPLALRYDYWNWTGQSVPFQNYVAWFAFTFCMMLFFFARKFRKQNRAGLALFISQVIFVMILNWWS